MTHPLAVLLESKPVLLADGATGTTLFEFGLSSGDAPELWNIDQPDNIRKLHQQFIDAGSDIVLTNSFGGTRQRLKLHQAEHRVHELNKRAAELARECADSSSRKIIVGGSVGPTGELFEPLGLLNQAQAVESFGEQMQGLKDGGADLAWIETMSAAEEIVAAAMAANEVDIPYCFTGSFDTAGKTMMGLEPSAIHDVCASLAEAPVALGANCGVGAPDILSSLLDMSRSKPQTPLIVKGNCGIPKFKGTEIVYSGTPALMASYAELAISAGASIVGGCCGTNAKHIQAMRIAIDEYETSDRPSLDQITSVLGKLVNNTASSTKKVKPARGRRRRRKS